MKTIFFILLTTLFSSEAQLTFKVESNTPVSFQYMASGDTTVFKTPYTFTVSSKTADIRIKSLEESVSLNLEQIDSEDKLSARGSDIQLTVKGSLVQVRGQLN